MSRENVEVMEEAYAAITRGDLDAFLALAHPEIEFRSLIAEAEGRTFRGHDGVREWWDSVIQSFGTRPGPEQIEGFRDRGISRLGLVGTVAGVQVPQTMWMAWRVRDGLLAWWETFRTEDEALQAVGLRE
jgi:ketosteroid isomerase-like protein